MYLLATELVYWDDEGEKGEEFDGMREGELCAELEEAADGHFAVELLARYQKFGPS